MISKTNSNSSMIGGIVPVSGMSQVMLHNNPRPPQMKKVSPAVELYLECISAITRGDHEHVRTCIARGVNVHARNSLGQTPLIMAAFFGQVPILRDFLKKNLDINAQSRNKETALFFAAWRGHVAAVQLLCRHGANRSLQDNNGMTPLMAAAKNGHYSVVRELIAADQEAMDTAPSGFSVLAIGLNQRDRLKWSAIDHAKKNGYHNIVAALREVGETSTHPFVDASGRDTLMRTMLDGDQGAARYCLRMGYIDIRHTDHLKITSLMYAAAHGSVDIVEQLLDLGADPDAQDQEGMTALMWAIKENKQSNVNVLLDWDANRNIQDKNGHTALMHAVRARQYDVVKNMLDRDWNMDIDLKDQKGKTALLHAVESGHVWIVEKLLEWDADAALADNDGQTPLQMAASRGIPAMVELLLDHGTRK